jgi:hypothetical protein
MTSLLDFLPLTACFLKSSETLPQLLKHVNLGEKTGVFKVRGLGTEIVWELVSRYNWLWLEGKNEEKIGDRLGNFIGLGFHRRGVGREG